MTFKDLFEKSTKGNMLTEFRKLKIAPDVVCEYHGKDNDIEIYKIHNLHFEYSIIIKHNITKEKFYISHYSDFNPQKTDDVENYINLNLATPVLIKKELVETLESINYFTEKLKEFDDAENLMSIDDINSLNNVFNALGIVSNIIIVDREHPHSIWALFRFYKVDNLSKIVAWVKDYLDDK